MLNVSIATVITMNKLDKTVTRENVMALAHQVVRGVRAVIRGETYADMFKVAIKKLYSIIKEAEIKAKMEANKPVAHRLNALIVGYGFLYKDLIRYTDSMGFRVEEFEALQECRDIFKNGMFASTKAVKLDSDQRKRLLQRLTSHCETLFNDLLKVLPAHEKEIAKTEFAKTFAPVPEDEAFLWA